MVACISLRLDKLERMLPDWVITNIYWREVYEDGLAMWRASFDWSVLDAALLTPPIAAPVTPLLPPLPPALLPQLPPLLDALDDEDMAEAINRIASLAQADFSLFPSSVIPFSSLITMWGGCVGVWVCGCVCICQCEYVCVGVWVNVCLRMWYGYEFVRCVWVCVCVYVSVCECVLVCDVWECNCVRVRLNVVCRCVCVCVNVVCRYVDVCVNVMLIFMFKYKIKLTFRSIKNIISLLKYSHCTNTYKKYIKMYIHYNWN